MAEFFIHPGGVDLHDHFREPSKINLSENFASGTKAAVFGGYVVVNDMPNTPGHETWTTDRLAEKAYHIEQGSYLPIGIIIGMQPEADNVGEIPGMLPRAIAGKQYYTWTQGNDRELGPDDFREQTRAFHEADPNKPIMVHAGEDVEGIIGMVAGDFRQPLHFCHVNDPETVKLINEQKTKHDTPITTGVTPHHIFKSSFDTHTEGWFARMQPPLADQADAEQLFDMLVRGDIDIIETDHAPHSKDAKWKAQEHNPSCERDGASCFGVTNIEFALPMLFYQQKLGRISMDRLIEVTSTKPAEIIGITLSQRTRVMWDLNKEYRINEENDVVSGSGWTPFQGKLAVGRVVEVIVDGVNLSYNTGVSTVSESGTSSQLVKSRHPRLLQRGDRL